MAVSIQLKRFVGFATGSHTSESNVARIAMLSAVPKKGERELHSPIDMLPDEVLLEIFNHHRLNTEPYTLSFRPWKWHRLAHVSRRWRTVIFGSPNLLKLQLVYTYNKPARKNLDCWPDLPLSIRYPLLPPYHCTRTDEENIIAALKHPSRICEINLFMSLPLFEKLAPLMRDPFPMLETLKLASPDGFVVPSTLLGGSAPQLRSISLCGTPFPSVPQFLLTAPALVSFRFLPLLTIGYLSPDALVAGLDAKPRLETLHIDGCIPNPGQQSLRTPYPQTCIVLPALTRFRFSGDIKYLKDLISRIDTPNLEQLFVTLSDHRTFDFPRLAEFISRTKHLTSSPYRMSIRLLRRSCGITYYFALPFPSRIFELKFLCDKSTGHIKPIIHACRQLSLLLSNVERLTIKPGKVQSDWRDKPTDTVRWLEWLELFSLFGAVRTLELIGDPILSVASALEQSSNMGYGTVLPFLQDLHMRCLESSAPELESFLAFRRHSGRVVSVHYIKEESEGHDP